MANKQKTLGKNLIYLSLALAIIFSVGQFTDLYSSGAVVFDDSIDYDDRLEPSYNIGGTNCVYEDSLWRMESSKPGSVCSFAIKEGTSVWDLGTDESTGILINGGGGTASVIATTDMKGRDLKILVSSGGCSVTGSGGHFGGSSVISIGNENFDVSNKCVLNAVEGVKRNTIEMVSSKLDANIADIFLNDRFLKTVNFTGLDKVEVKFTSDGVRDIFVIESFTFKIPFSFQLRENEHIGRTTIIGEKTFSLYDLDRIPTQFNIDLPPLIIDLEEGGATTRGTNEIYQRLKNGERLTVPKGQLWQLTYGFVDDSIFCPEGDFFDFNDEQCIALVSFCGAKQVWDGVKCTASVTESDERECGDFALWDRTTDPPICRLNLNHRGICEMGDYSFLNLRCEHPYDGQCFPRYEKEGDVCWAEPVANIICRPNLSFNPISGYCENEDGSIQETIITDLNEICELLEGNLTKAVTGEDTCVYLPENEELIKQVIQEVIVTETDYITETITITETLEVEKDKFFNILVGVFIGLIFATGVLLLKNKK